MSTSTQLLRLAWRRARLLVPLLGLSGLARAQNNAYFSAGALSYETGAADNHAVRLTVRETYSSIGRARPVVGQLLPSTSTLEFGDATAPQAVALTVTRVGDDDYTGEFTTTHTYATAGAFTATVSGCCRVNTRPFAFNATGRAGVANDAPVATVGPLVRLAPAAGQPTASFAITARDPNDDPLSYRLATGDEAGDVSGFTNPAGLRVDPATGLVSFDTQGPARYFTAAVVVSDGAASILVDQLVLVEGANVAPTFAAFPTPPNGQRIVVTAGTPTSFTVRANDANVGDVLTLQATGVPVGAWFTPGLPATATSLVETVFAWTPDPTVEGVFPLTFTVTDGHGGRATTSLVLEVRRALAPVFVAPTPPDRQEFTLAPGQSVNFTVKASSPSPGGSVSLRLVTALPPGAVLTPDLPTGGNPAQATFSWTPSSFSSGRYEVVFEGRDQLGTLIYTGVVVNVTGAAVAPVFVAPTPANGAVFRTGPGQAVSFPVRATDADAGDVVTLQAANVPPGATLSPDLPASGNPAQTTFTWTPTAAQVGTYLVTFGARDRGGLLAAPVGINIEVAAPACDPAANSPVANADQLTAALCGGPLTITPAQLLANDTDPLGRTLRVASAGPATNGTVVSNADGTLTFTPTPGFTGRASFQYLVQLAGPVLAAPATGHYYEFVSAPGYCWTMARDSAAARRYQGLRGYLATITSASERGFLENRGAGKYWFGASDEDVEGEWRWQTGPEAGQLFWRGAADGTAVNNAYANWSPGEPNDFKNQYRPAGEDYGQLYGGAGGRWNDLANCAGAEISGYVVEYGGLEACPPVLYAFGNVTIDVPAPTPAPVANPDQLSTARDTPLQVGQNLQFNDSDPLGRSLLVTSVSQPSSGRFVANADNSFTYLPAPGFVGTATFTYVLQVRDIVRASAATGHYYEFVGLSTSPLGGRESLCWTSARNAASRRTFNGMRGYLATITSAAEQEFLVNTQRIFPPGVNPDRFFFGAADDSLEGQWRWQDGPEAGQLFWRGGPDGAPVNGAFANWSPGQPDDYKNQYRPAGEDYAQLYGGSGLWNDAAACAPSNQAGFFDTGYLVEYGGLEACTPVLFAVGTATITVGGPAAAVAAAKSAKAAPAASARAAGSASVLAALPNPSDGSFRLRMVAEADGPAQVELFDLQGRRVKAVFSGSLRAGELREISVSAPELATGVYVVRLQSGKQVQHRRLSIQH